MARTTQKTAKNITIDQGSTYSEEFTVTSDGDTAVNITGMTVAAQIRKKTFVLRKTTDRPEAVKSGFSELIGTNPARIKSALKRGFDSKIPHKKSPFGDGKTAEKILKVLYNNF